MQCTNPISITHKQNELLYPQGMIVPCGKCSNCRISYRREWSARMLHELDSWDRSSFITLTYNEEHKHPCSSLQKDHLQKFFKRLRKDLDKDKRKIKYFAVGEYGDETERPHYHAIMFGLGLQPEDKLKVIENWPMCDWDSLLDDPRGSPFGKVEFESIQYVASYVDKKYNGDLAWGEYTLRGRDPVFRLISNGIGKEHCLKNKKQYEDNMKITVRGNPISLPRYYLNLIEPKRDIPRKHIEEKEKKFIYKHTGDYILKKELYSTHNIKKTIKIDKIESAERVQRNRNTEARKSLKKDRKI